MKKNILLITADQWRGDCLGFAGHPVVKTPNLDKFAEQSVYFSRHYAGAAPCSPARACLYTGLYQMNNRVCKNGTPLDQRHDNLALAARRAGYDPTVFGYTDQSADPRTLDAGDARLRTYEGILPGFSTRIQLADHESRWLGWLQRNGYQGKLKTPEIHFPANGITDPPSQSPPAYSADQTQTAYITSEFIDWIQEWPYFGGYTDAGWFAHVSFLRPHPPFSVPEPYSSMYAPGDVPEFAGPTDWHAVASQHPFLGFAFENLKKSSFVPGLQGAVNEWDKAALKTIAALYFGMVTEVDAQLGRLFKALKQAQMWDNTIIIFTSDHGEMLGDHCLLGKLGYHESSYHIPLLIRDPELPQAHGSKVQEFTEAIDVFPTLMSMINQPIPAQLDGKTLYPALQAQALHNWRSAVHWEFDFRDVQHQSAERKFGITSQECNLSVIRDERFKYVHFAALPPLLFDLEADPGESDNVAELNEFQPIRLQYAEKLLGWRAAHLDQSLAQTTLSSQGWLKNPG